MSSAYANILNSSLPIFIPLEACLHFYTYTKPNQIILVINGPPVSDRFIFKKLTKQRPEKRLTSRSHLCPVDQVNMKGPMLDGFLYYTIPAKGRKHLWLHQGQLKNPTNPTDLQIASHRSQRTYIM